MHTNVVNCQSCEEKLATLKSDKLATWARQFRQANTDAHISCAYRGKDEQEADFAKGASRAHWGQSAHNYGYALDWFRLTANGASFDRPWYELTLAPAARAAGLIWGGDFKSIMDMPHVEDYSWHDLPRKQ